MFATPALPMTPNLLSSSEIMDIHRKMKALNKLLCHPRAETDEIKPFVMQIHLYYHAVSLTETWVYRENTRQKYYDSLRRIAPIEDIVIKYVLHGTSLKDLVSNLKQQHPTA